MNRFKQVIFYIFINSTILVACRKHSWPKPQISPNGPIAYYPFSGNARDVIGEHHGNVFGALLTTDRFGKSNSAYYFDHNKQNYIEVPFSPDFTPDSNGLSISLWFQSKGGVSSRGALIDWYRCGVNPWCVNADAAAYSVFIQPSGRLTYFIRGDSQPIDSLYSFTTTAPYTDGKWHHVVLAFSSPAKVKTCFLDDVIIESLYAPVNPLTDGGFKIPLSFGREFITGWNDPTYYFEGKLDDIKIYRRVLTKYDVDTLFH